MISTPFSTGLWCSLIVTALLAGAGCGGADCEALCTEAQAGACTSIRGNCASFCSALDNVDDPAGCTSQRDSYESCLGDGANVCDTNCDATENALGTCVGTYCASRPSDPSCATLISSF